MRFVGLIGVALLIALAPVAEASFPGRNGDILLTESQDRPFSEYVDLLRIDPRSGAVARTPVCRRTPEPGEPPECISTGPPAASPDGGSVAFAAGEPVPIPSDLPPIVSLRVLSGSEWTRQVLPVTPMRFATTVRWTHDGRLVVLTSGRRALLVDGAELRPLISNVSALDVSSDGRLAFVRHGALRVRDADGDVRRLSARGAGQPSWSPRGKRIAFARKGWVYAVRARGGRPRRLTRGFGPIWSPDGRQIAFFRTVSAPGYDGGTTRVFALDRRTGRVRRVSSQAITPNDEVSPRGMDWQPER